MAKLDAKLAATGTSRSAFVRECVEKYIAEPTADPAGALLDAIKNELAVVAVFILSAQQKRWSRPPTRSPPSAPRT
uniref:ribbon-helix-helix protein, CopG family n=1 Tax=Frigoriglobus tundricola TaxID=2774151 RepID=UPI0036F36182